MTLKKQKHWGLILKETLGEWWDNDPFDQSALIAYYAIFSLPLLLFIVIYVAGLAYDQIDTGGKIAGAISDTFGQGAAHQFEKILIKNTAGQISLFTKITGLVTFIFGTTGVFLVLQRSLNTIWGAKTPSGFVTYLKDNLFSFGLVVLTGLLLSFSLVITSLLNNFSSWISHNYSKTALILIHGINIAFFWGVTSSLFAVIFKVIPAKKTEWKHIWPGAMVTAFLFIIGKYVMGYYFTEFRPASIYGAAGSIVLILLWVTYSYMIMLFGAQFTHQLTVREK